LKLKPISSKEIYFLADTNSKNTITGEYKDPLMRWPLRGAAFTNEVGEAMRPLIGKYATLSWVPALLYIGADVYDKYKNNETEYSPSSKRCLKQAVFQGMASIFLPLVAVKLGQNIFSLIGLASKDKLSINKKEQIIELAQEYVANGKMRAYKNDEKGCINEFLEIISNNINYKKEVHKNKNIIRKIHYYLEEKFYKLLKIDNKKNIENFATETIESLIDIRKNLLNPSENFMNNKLYRQFLLDMEKGQTKNVAVKSVLNAHLSNKGLVGKFIKTVGGFIALASLIRPIDNFVENVLIGKFVAPTLDKHNKKQD